MRPNGGVGGGWEGGGADAKWRGAGQRYHVFRVFGCKLYGNRINGLEMGKRSLPITACVQSDFVQIVVGIAAATVERARGEGSFRVCIDARRRRRQHFRLRTVSHLTTQTLDTHTHTHTANGQYLPDEVASGVRRANVHAVGGWRRSN